jgi:hypothetical protein
LTVFSLVAFEAKMHLEFSVRVVYRARAREGVWVWDKTLPPNKPKSLKATLGYILV